jgi:hypothetical protein
MLDSMFDTGAVIRLISKNHTTPSLLYDDAMLFVRER